MATRNILLLVALVAVVMAAPILTAQFHGEDEVGVYITANWLALSLSKGDWLPFGQVLVGSYHPPGRFLLATVSFLLFGPSIVALRLPAVVVWVATCVLAADITRRLVNKWAGLITGILLGASGLFSLEAMGFGHGVLTFWVMLFIWLKLKNPIWDLDSYRARRHYLLGGSILALGFLWFTSLLPIAGMYHLYYFYLVARQKNLEKVRQYLLLTIPFIFFYVGYYLIFLGLPQFAITHGIRERAVGQLHQNIARAQSAHFNTQSFIENIRGLNWYHLPFVSWFLLLIGVVAQWRYARILFWLLMPYALLFSFYIVDNTSQHFLSYYIWLLPFAVAGLWQWGQRRGRDWQGVVICALAAMCISAAAFGYVTSVRRYTEASYPYGLETKVFGLSKWRTNLDRPLPQIAADLERILEPADQWTATTDGTLPLYYFPDPRYVSPEEVSCQNLRAYVRSRTQPLLCDLVPEEVLTYPESFLEVVLVRFTR